VSARAGIVVTGTEVLTGIITDRNGPWVSERLRELGVDAAHIGIVGDRRADMEAQLRFLASEGMALIVTSGGLGPTADDLTAEVVGRFQGREMVLDEGLEERIWAILEPLRRRWPELDEDAIRRSNRKQAVVPDGATILEPVGTAPGLVVPPASGEGPTVVVLPGPPRELQPMWRTAVETAALPGRRPGADRLPRGRPAAVRDSRVRNRSNAAGGRVRRGCRSTSSRSRRACGAGRSRSPRGTSPRRRTPTTGSSR
jgi:nicotinamide-nucleotide amidase